MKKPKAVRDKIIVAVTGSLGTGKSTVAKMLARRLAKIIDADAIAHNLFMSRGKVYRAIVCMCGDRCISQGHIDRKIVARIVFEDKRLLKELNRIVHPEVVRLIKKEITQAKQKLVVLDVPLLFEARLENLADSIIVVKACRDTQLKRLKKERHLSKQEALLRINAQMPLSKKIRLADFVIDNNGTVSQTEKQVGTLRRLLWKN